MSSGQEYPAVSGLPVEDPVLDTAVVVASRVAGGGQWVNNF